ncbi:MAG: nucleotide exchange factor GrpE [Ignavibacteria bacterium]|nr:nucleotide exchange factor GrpE [Ignavibacteria bacterium]
MQEKDKSPNDVQNQETQPRSDEGASLTPSDEAGQKLAEAEKQIEYYKDLLLRKAAEFDNYKKRAENESGSTIKLAKGEVIADLLPIVDDFDRSMKLGKDRRESDAFLKGVELIYQKLQKFLEAQGVRPLESLGKEFDVHFHDALLQVPRDDVPPHTVIEEVEKGYMLDDRILRHSKVIVSTAVPDGGKPEPAPRATSSQPKTNPATGK